MQLLDPANILRRGFSITMLNGKPVTDAAQLPEGTVIETTLYEGSVKSVVQ